SFSTAVKASLGSRAERVQWTKQRRRGWRSAPFFASARRGAPQKSAKRKKHERRPLPVAETGSREWRSAPFFASVRRGAPQKSAKRKRERLSIVVVVQFQHGGKGFAGQTHRPQLAHLLFAFLLLFQQLFLAGDVAAVALGQHVLAQGLD